MPLKAKPYVKVYFRSDGQLYSCESYGRVIGKQMGPIGMTLLKLDDNYNVIEDLTQSTVNKTRQFIQSNILGCSFTVFKSSIVMTSADFTNFYEGLSKDQKRKYVESIFNLDCFGEMFNLVKMDINNTKKEITNLKTQIISTSSRIEDLVKKSVTYMDDQNQKKEELKQDLASKKKEIVEMMKKLESMDPGDDAEVKKKFSEIDGKLEQLKRKKSEVEKEIVRCESTISHDEKLVAQIKAITSGLCEKCTALLQGRNSYDKWLKERDKCKEEIEKDRIIVEDLSSQMKSASEKRTQVFNELETVSKAKLDFADLKMKVKYAGSELKLLKKQYDDFDSSIENPFTELVEKAQEELKGMKDMLSNFLKNIKHLEILKEASSENGIKKFIMKDIVKLLNSLIQKYLNEIGSEFIVYFDETFEFKFITTTGECEFSNFSAGEKQRIQIATLLAFRDLILNGKISSNIFIIDELLDANVDTACIENVMGILKRKSAETGQSIFIISHRSELADNMSFWNNIIKVVKENQQTRYEVI